MVNKEQAVSKNLASELENVLMEYKIYKVYEALNNSEKAEKCLKNLLDQFTNLPKSSFTSRRLKEKYGPRFNHLLLTFALGLYIAKFDGLKDKIEKAYGRFYKIEKNVFFKTWLIVSLFHDYGYFLFDKYPMIRSLNEFGVLHNILFDNEENESMKMFFPKENNNRCRYSSEVVEEYFCSSCSAYENDKSKIFNREPFDHGIGGGFVLYDELLKDKTEKNLYETGWDLHNFNEFASDICFKIIEHNIWTIDLHDEYFKPYYESPKLKPIRKSEFKKISDNEEPLLYLLSLVDTIEFVKKLDNKSVSNGEETTSNPRPLTICKKIGIYVSKNQLKLTFKDVPSFNRKNSWINGIKRLKDWVDVGVVAGSEDFYMLANGIDFINVLFTEGIPDEE